MTLRLDVEAVDGTARATTVTTARGSFSTPCFMPVGTRAAVRAASTADIEDIGAEVLLANGLEEEAKGALAVARRRLLAHADRASDPALRQTFLTCIPKNVKLLALAERLLGET